MLKRILSINGQEGVISQSAQLTSFSPDTLYIKTQGLPVFPKDAEGNIDLTGSVMDSDLGTVKINVYLKNELGNDIQLVNNVPLAMFALMSDYNGASAYANSYDYEGAVLDGAFEKGKQIAIPLGDVILQGDDILTVSLTGKVVSADWSIKMWASDEISLNQEILLTYAYVKGLDSQSFMFRNVMELFSYGLTDSETVVTDYFGTNSIDYEGLIAKALCNGRYEYTDGQHLAPYAKLWGDVTNWSQDITFTTVSNVHYMAVGRAFAPERKVRADKDVRNFTAYKQSIIANDSVKTKVLGLKN